MPEVRVSTQQDGVPTAVNPVTVVAATILRPEVCGLLTQPGNAVGDALASKSDGKILVKASAPTTSDIPAGTFRVCKNTTNNRISLFVNDGGTIIDLLTFTPAT